MLPGYPVILDLRDQPCVVIGGGAAAEEKVRGLIEAGARVIVISPRVTPELHSLAAAGSLTWVPRAFQAGDLAGAFLAVAAAEDRSGNAQLWDEARGERVLLNALDDPPHCRFIYPSVHRTGALLVAVSTGGIAPALAVRIRQRLAADLGPEYAAFLDLAASWRERIAAAVPSFERRKALWYEIVDSDILALLRSGDTTSAARRFADLVESASVS